MLKESCWKKCKVSFTLFILNGAHCFRHLAYKYIVPAVSHPLIVSCSIMVAYFVKDNNVLGSDVSVLRY